MVCWLPERFDDLLFRIDTLYRDERGRKASGDYIYIFEEGHVIVGVIIPDGDSFNSSIKSGHEHIFGEMLDLAEKKLQPLFERDKNGEIDFLVISHDSLEYQTTELLKRGYLKDKAEVKITTMFSILWKRSMIFRFHMDSSKYSVTYWMKTVKQGLVITVFIPKMMMAY